MSRMLVRSMLTTRGIVAQPLVQLAVPDVDGDDLGRAALQQAVGEAAGRRPGVEGPHAGRRRSRTRRGRGRA